VLLVLVRSIGKYISPRFTTAGDFSELLREQKFTPYACAWEYQMAAATMVAVMSTESKDVHPFFKRGGGKF
jgi:hypothetical protein